MKLHSKSKWTPAQKILRYKNEIKWKSLEKGKVKAFLVLD